MKATGRRGKNVHLLFQPNALFDLPEDAYWDLLQFILDDLERPAPAFPRFALLAQSILGGCCWPGVERWLASLSVSQLLPTIFYGPMLCEERKQLEYPIYVDHAVYLSLGLLLVERMRENPVRNGDLRLLENETPISSEKHSRQWRVNDMVKYLADTASSIQLGYTPTLQEWQATSRWLMTRIYSLDIAHAVLGSIDVTAPPLKQLSQHEPSIWLKLITEQLGDRNV